MPAPDETNDENEALRAAHAAFVAGDYAESRRLAARAAAEGTGRSAAARAFLERYAPDPVVTVIVLAALAFFVACILTYGGR